MDKSKLKNLAMNFELYIGSVFLAITTVIVIMNVFTRYFLKFTYHWTEEVAVGSFVWVIFLGFASAFKKKGLIGVEILTKLLPGKAKLIVEMIMCVVTIIISGVMFYFSLIYVMGSTKITPALEFSYKYIYSAMVLSFTLISIYSVIFLIQSIKTFRSNDPAELAAEAAEDLAEDIERYSDDIQ